MKKFGKILFYLTVIFFLSTGAALADKSAIIIIAPESTAKGTEVTIKINVTHHGNNMFHYTNWVYVKINGKELARWDFSATKTPESENFTKEIKYTVNEPAQIEAEANCNIHGSAGIAKAGISIK
jgi:desulfoferrodoxin (superoxide reductase-like protein)